LELICGTQYVLFTLLHLREIARRTSAAEDFICDVELQVMNYGFLVLLLPLQKDPVTAPSICRKIGSSKLNQILPGTTLQVQGFSA
jgi:hypothetical protein